MSPGGTASDKQSWGRRLALLSVGLLLLGIAHYLYAYSAVLERIRLLRAEIGAVELAEKTRQQSRFRTPELEQELQQLNSAVREGLEAIAHVGDRPLILAQLSQLAQAAGLEIESFRPQEKIVHEGHVELPVRLDLAGTFHEFSSFLSTLATIPHLSRFGNLAIVSGGAIQNPPSRRISLEILTYGVPEALAQHAASVRLDPLGELPLLALDPLRAAEEAFANGLRDPFLPPDATPCGLAGNGLETYDLTELRLAGIVWDSQAPKGLVVDNANTGHVVTPGSRIGNRGGIVEAITPTHIVVRENAPDRPATPTVLALPVFRFGPVPEEAEKSGRTDGEKVKAGGKPAHGQSGCAASQ